MFKNFHGNYRFHARKKTSGPLTKRIYIYCFGNIFRLGALGAQFLENEITFYRFQLWAEKCVKRTRNMNGFSGYLSKNIPDSFWKSWFHLQKKSSGPLTKRIYIYCFGNILRLGLLGAQNLENKLTFMHSSSGLRNVSNDKEYEGYLRISLY